MRDFTCGIRVSDGLFGGFLPFRGCRVFSNLQQGLGRAQTESRRPLQSTSSPCCRNIYASPLVYTRIMALSIKDPDADRLARELAARTGETLTEAIVMSLRERLEREKKRTRRRGLAEELGEIGRRCASLPVIDARTPDQILGYDKRGLPR